MSIDTHTQYLKQLQPLIRDFDQNRIELIRCLTHIGYTKHSNRMKKASLILNEMISIAAKFDLLEEENNG